MKDKNEPCSLKQFTEKYFQRPTSPSFFVRSLPFWNPREIRSIEDLFNTRGKPIDPEAKHTLVALGWVSIGEKQQLVVAETAPADFKEALKHYLQDIQKVNLLYRTYIGLEGHPDDAYRIFRYELPHLEEIQQRLQKENSPSAEMTLIKFKGIDREIYELPSTPSILP